MEMHRRLQGPEGHRASPGRATRGRLAGIARCGRLAAFTGLLSSSEHNLIGVAVHPATLGESARGQNLPIPEPDEHVRSTSVSCRTAAVPLEERGYVAPRSADSR